MVIRTFEGEDMQDVLRKVKKELGTEAVILGSQTRRTSGASRERVVVTAGLPGIDPPWLGGGRSPKRSGIVFRYGNPAFARGSGHAPRHCPEI